MIPGKIYLPEEIKKATSNEGTEMIMSVRVDEEKKDVDKNE